MFRVLNIKKNRMYKEIFVLKMFVKFINKGYLDLNNSFCKICYFDKRPVGYCLSFISQLKKDFLISYTVKGLNRVDDGGIRGVSDSMYLKMIDFCKSKSVYYINDGDLGVEDGTIKHKMGFKPINFIKSFDLDIYE